MAADSKSIDTTRIEEGRRLARALVGNAGQARPDPQRSAGPGESTDEQLEELGGWRYGAYWAFGAGERHALDRLLDTMVAYLLAPGDTPLSIGVFGPPGCGKSFAVGQLIAEAARQSHARATDLGAGSVRLTSVTINLTQMSGPSDLATALSRAVVPESAGAIPVVFFDEFDASRAGARLDWLAWFLAPMNDGEFRRAGVRVRTGKAIFIFAGGTCHTAAAFMQRRDQTFRAAKGPDFASRLAATFDVPGPNALDPEHPEHRMLRRALLIAAPFAKLRKARGARPIAFDDTLLDAVLDIDRYTHGARSVKLFVQALEAPDEQADTVDDSWVCTDGRLDAFFDRGPLDPVLVGGPIQFSGGARPSQQTQVEALWARIARRVFSAGSSIIYGGLYSQASDADRLVEHPSADLADVLRADPTLSRKRLPGQDPDETRLRILTDRDDTQGAMRYEAAPVGPEGPIRLFRMRVRMAREAVACVAMGGKSDGWSGRMSGLLEEVALALVHRRPIYLLGHPGMAVGQLGPLLALDDAWAGTPKSLLESPNQTPSGDDPDTFGLPGVEHPILTARDAVDILRHHALGSRQWIPNGLSDAENRELFRADGQRAADLVIKGLTAILEAR